MIYLAIKKLGYCCFLTFVVAYVIRLFWSFKQQNLFFFFIRNSISCTLHHNSRAYLSSTFFGRGTKKHSRNPVIKILIYK